MIFACRNKTMHVIYQCVVYAMAKVGNAHLTSSRRLNRTAMQPHRGGLFVAMESKHHKSSVGAACCVLVGHVFAFDKKTNSRNRDGCATVVG